MKRGDHLAPTCEHGTWTFAGADFKRKATKWRCPTAECEPKSVWRKASRLHPLIPRETKRWRSLYKVGRLSSASLGGSRTSTDSRRSVFVGWSVSNFTPIL